MFKRQASVQNKLAAAIVSALFLSVSAHAGLLGAGGIATGVTNANVGSMTGRLGAGTPIPTMNPSTLNAATQASSHTRAQGAFSAPITAPITTPNAAATVQQASQAGAGAAGLASAGQAAAISNGEDITLQAERLTRKGRTTGQIMMEQASDAQGQVSAQALRAKQSGEANATTQVTNVASRKPQIAANGSGSASGSAQASGGSASVSGDASARGAASVGN